MYAARVIGTRQCQPSDFIRSNFRKQFSRRSVRANLPFQDTSRARCKSNQNTDVYTISPPVFSFLFFSPVPAPPLAAHFFVPFTALHLYIMYVYNTLFIVNTILAGCGGIPYLVLYSERRSSRAPSAGPAPYRSPGKSLASVQKNE